MTVLAPGCELFYGRKLLLCHCLRRPSSYRNLVKIQAEQSVNWNCSHSCRIELRTGDHHTAQTQINKARRLANVSANLYQKARTLGAECTTQLGDYQDSIVQFWGAAEILAICGMSGGGLDGYIKCLEQRFMKSEYTEARSSDTEYSTVVYLSTSRTAVR